jgi:hypothetical protein
LLLARISHQVFVARTHHRAIGPGGPMAGAGQIGVPAGRRTAGVFDNTSRSAGRGSDEMTCPCRPQQKTW